MYKKYTFNYKKFTKNLVITSVIWGILGGAGYTIMANSDKVYTVDKEVTDVYFGFEENQYENVDEVTFLHALNMDELLTQPETDKEQNVSEKVNVTKEDLQLLNDISYLKSNFYIVDKRTDLLADDIKPEEFLATDYTVDNQSDGPKILIFHTHFYEAYSDSKDSSEGVWGVGEELKNQLEQKYGVEVLHYDGAFYKSSKFPTEYESMEPVIRQILKDNPSIEVVIDIHRDGVKEEVHLVEEINGVQCAKVMFFNGLSRVYDDGVLTNIESLKNVYLNDNLGLSFNLQLTANSLYPGLTRKVYLNAYRYSLHMKAKSILIEVGAQTNTYQEALNAMDPLSDVFGTVLVGE